MAAFQSDPFYYRVTGDFALFTDPSTKGGGEKFTYPVPTYQALKGITENIYWKPTLIHFIDEVKVINKIQTISMGALPLTRGNRSRNLSQYTYLYDVEYLVKFHFEWNMNRKELAPDRNAKKHQCILLRSLKRGGRRDLFLGTRECVAFEEKVTATEYAEAKSYYDNQQMSFGMMFHSFTYPGEAITQSDKLYTNFAPVVMDGGVIRFRRPEDCPIHQEIRDYPTKEYGMDDIRPVDQEERDMQ